jgi:hypothetical protein
MRRIAIARRYCLLVLLAANRSWAAPKHFDWKGLAYALDKYVQEDGRVHFGALKADLKPLQATVDALAHFDAERLPSREAKLAHWINVYNALVLYSTAIDYPDQKGRLANPLKRAAYFYGRKFSLGGAARTLASVEDKSLRSFKDPRVHFALFSANRSCAALSRKVFEPKSLDEQLEEATTAFLGQSRNVSLDKVRRIAKVSEIFKWFRKDFGGNEGAVLRFLAKRLPGQAINATSWKLQYFDWDWSINDVT